MSESTDRALNLIRQFDTRVQAAPADSWVNQSPCTEWSARAVASHVSNNLLRVAGAMTAQELDPIAADEEFPAAWDRTLAVFGAALDSGNLAATINGPFGPQPAEEFIGRILSTDVLVHTWDLARATGGDERLDADAVSAAFSGLKPFDGLLRGPNFGARIDSAPDADEQTQFLNFLGRPV